MSLPLVSLDTLYPPTWNGTPLAVPEVIDADTALRATVGDDPVNYFVSQRVEGDLFHRDLVLAKAINDLSGYMSNYSGLVWNLPAVSVAPGQEVRFADVPLAPTAHGYLLVGAGVRSLYTGSANAGVKIYSGSGTLLCSVNSLTDAHWVQQDEPAGIPLTLTSGFRVTAYNDDPALDFVLSGWVAVLPRVNG